MADISKLGVLLNNDEWSQDEILFPMSETPGMENEDEEDINDIQRNTNSTTSDNNDKKQGSFFIYCTINISLYVGNKSRNKFRNISKV